MNYFAKYLPVEGEIEPQAKVKSNGTIVTAIEKEGEGDTWLTDGFPKYVSNIQKVQLFLCSRDIQIGDRLTILQYNGDPNWEATLVREDGESFFYCDHLPETGLHNGFGVLKKDTLKVIGRISPQALWVKEGDEFNLHIPLKTLNVDHLNSPNSPEKNVLF